MKMMDHFDISKNINVAIYLQVFTMLAFLTYFFIFCGSELCLKKLFGQII